MRRIPDEPLACYSGEPCEYLVAGFMILFALAFMWLLADGLFRFGARK